MLSIQKIAQTFTKVKPLKISVLSVEPTLKIKSQTSDHQWEVKNALQNLLASLVACQIATLKDMSNKAKLKIHSIKINKVQSSYDLNNYIKGGLTNKLNDIAIEAQFQTSGTQQDLDEIHKKVQNSCPVYQMLKCSGVKISNSWKNIKKLE